MVVHLPATDARTRAVVAWLAAVTGRTAHLLWLHVDPEDARRGQSERGRVVRAASFAGHARRAEASVAELRAGSAVRLGERHGGRTRRGARRPADHRHRHPVVAGPQ